MILNNFKKCAFFIDFDGTITKEDTIDKLLNDYASEEWLYIESLWEKGFIGSKECLERQINCISNFTNTQLKQFISKIEIDETFLNFIHILNSSNIEFFIVSDGFDLLITKILSKYNVKNIQIFSNQLKLVENTLKPAFPLSKDDCKSQSGLCKCAIVKNHAKNKEIIYIGDGRSDFCASKHANIIFAKGKLAKYCDDSGIEYTPFITFNDIMTKLNEKEHQNLVKDRLTIG